MIKPAYQTAIDRTTYEKPSVFFEKLMKILHPFMPFLTEEIWHTLREREEGDDIMINSMPVAKVYDKRILEAFDESAEVINQIRKVRKEKNIPQKETLQLFFTAEGLNQTEFAAVISKLGNIESFEKVEEKPEASISFIANAQEYFIPLSDNVDVEAEIEKLEADLKYQEGFLKSVEKKLSNDRFVNNAPDKVVEMEKKKKTDALEKIGKIEEMLANLRK